VSVDEDVLKGIFKLADQVGSVPFPNIVKASSGFEVLPVNLADKMDKELIDKLNQILKSYLHTLAKTHYRLQGARANEVGSRIEAGLVHEMTRFSLQVRQLVEKGYPDIEILQDDDRLTYLEVKATSTVEPSDFRYFYYSSGKKIKGNARHLVLNIAIAKEAPEYWRIEKCAISDLSKLKVRLKAEFNATQREILDKSLEIFSSSPPSK
jgi:hypothetical protein